MIQLTLEIHQGFALYIGATHTMPGRRRLGQRQAALRPGGRAAISRRARVIIFRTTFPMAPSSPLAQSAEQDAVVLKRVVVDSDAIAYRESGSGATVVLIHGMFGDGLDWEPVFAPLAQKHRVIALDLPGFGESAKPRVEYTAEFFATRLHMFLESLRIEHATLVGNSFGGILCMHYALQYPESVAGLVLIGSGGFRLWRKEDCDAALVRFSEENIRRFTPAYHELLFAQLFVKGRSPFSLRYLAKQDDKLSRSDFNEYACAVHSSIKMALEADLGNDLARIQAPVLVIHGEKDPIIPLKWAREAAAKFPHGELREVKDCGHVPQMECVPEVVDAITNFVARQG